MIDSQGRKWEVVERVDGSIVCFYTMPGVSAHFVVWDSLDRSPIPQGVDWAAPGSELTVKTYWKDGKLVDERDIPPRS